MTEIDKHTRQKLTDAGIIPEAIETALQIESWLDAHPKETLTSYGHGVAMLGLVILSGEKVPVEKQRRELRENALTLIEKYGDHIVEFMRPELKEALELNQDRG